MMNKYTLAAGRCILLDGVPLCTINRCNHTDPVAVDQFARLCAAAPTLLAACKDVIGWYASTSVAAAMSDAGEQAEYHRTLNAARAAIARAEGMGQ